MKTQNGKKNFFYHYFFAFSLVGFAGLVLYATVPQKNDTHGALAPEEKNTTIEQKHIPQKHVQADVVKAIYVTMYTAGSTKKMDALIALADATEVNAMVVAVKGSLGELIYDMFDAPALVA